MLRSKCTYNIKIITKCLNSSIILNVTCIFTLYTKFNNLLTKTGSALFAHFIYYSLISDDIDMY